METASKPITVTHTVYAKIKEWVDAGRVVNRFVCADLGCLTEFFSPNPVCGCPGHARSCPGHLETADVKLADLRVEPVIAKPVEFRDLTFYWRESNQMSIVMEAPGLARPVKVMSFGYIGGLMGMDRSTHAEIKRECGQRKPTKWVKSALESGELEAILNRLCLTLEEKEKVLEV